MVRRTLVSLLAVVAVAGGCADSGSDTTPVGDAAEGVRQLTVEVVDSHPHDTAAYTQGLLLDDGVFFESTGNYGRSDVRRVSVDEGVPSQREPLPADQFGEGLTLVGDRLIQLTWREGIARVYDRETLELVDEFQYDGEGWGLCLDDDRLVMSDGSATLTFRDTDTFDEIGSVEVSADGQSVDQLNELECVDGAVVANVYRTDRLVVIDPDTGDVTASVDASGLLDEAEAPTAEVLNGIAHDSATGHYYLTGKYWPTMFEVRFVDVADGG